MTDALYVILPAAMCLFVVAWLFSGYPVGAVLGGTGAFFGILGIALGVFQFGEFFSVLVRIWNTAAESQVLVAVPLFIFMGGILERCGIADDLLGALQDLLMHVPGGLGLAVVGMGTILAATTGIVGASVIMMTVLALPALLRSGYDKGLSGGVIAASGTLGILIPPSIMLIILAEMLTLSTGELFLAALLPGLLLSALYGTYLVARAVVSPASAPRVQSDTALGPRRLLGIAVALLPTTLLIVVVLGSIFLGWATATEAAGVGVAGALVLGAARGRLTRQSLSGAVEQSALTVAMVFFVILGATTFSYVLRSLGGDDLVRDAFGHVPGGSWGVLLAMMAIVFVLGFFFDWIEITLIMMPIFFPLLGSMDFGEHLARADIALWFAILFSVNLQSSFLTPPFGFALFFMKGAAGDRLKMQDLYRGVIPFVLLQLFGLALCIAFPAVVLRLPHLLLN